MDRRIAMVGLVSACLVASCAPAATPGATLLAEGQTPAPSAAAPSATTNPFGSWTPSAVAQLGTASSVALGDFFPQRLEAVADRFLLIGQDGQGSAFLIEGSAPGGWSRLDTAPLGPWIGSLAGGPLGAVLSIDDQTSGHVAKLWYSSDGLRWGQVDAPTGLDGASAEQLYAGPGGFAMTADLAASGSESGSEMQGVWTSTDGHDWVAVPSLQSAGVATVTPLAGAFVASGMDADGHPVVDVSSDGRTFHADPNAATSPLADGAVLSLAAGAKLLVLEPSASGWRRGSASHPRTPPRSAGLARRPAPSPGDRSSWVQRAVAA